jgi:hypothetical protein
MPVSLEKTNFAKSVLQADISSTDLQLTVSGGDGALFPSSGSFRAVIWGAQFATPLLDTSREIVTASLDSVDTFDIVRAQESTVAQAWDAAANFALVITAGVLGEYDDEINIAESKADSVQLESSVASSKADSAYAQSSTASSKADSNSLTLSSTESKADSNANRASQNTSVADSKADSNSQNISVADSKTLSNSQNISVADSKAVSNSQNVSIADSKAVSNSQNVSVADSKAISVSTNLSTTDSELTSFNLSVIYSKVWSAHP